VGAKKNPKEGENERYWILRVTGSGKGRKINMGLGKGVRAGRKPVKSPAGEEGWRKKTNTKGVRKRRVGINPKKASGGIEVESLKAAEEQLHHQCRSWGDSEREKKEHVQAQICRFPQRGGKKRAGYFLRKNQNVTKKKRRGRFLPVKKKKKQHTDQGISTGLTRPCLVMRTGGGEKE